MKLGESKIKNQNLQIQSELQPENLLISSIGLDVYVINADIAPRTMREIGRIREREFRIEGGGTGKTYDIDKFDIKHPMQNQIIAWDSKEQEIVAMYRYISGNVVHNYKNELPMAEFFEFSPQFVDEYLPYSFELGRSVVNRNARRSYKGLHAIWSGIGALLRENPQILYFMGKFSISSKISVSLRNRLYAMLYSWRKGSSNLITAKPEFCISQNTFHWEQGRTFKDDLQKIIDFASENKESIPPLVLSYARLSDTIEFFGTVLNSKFGNFEETALLIQVQDIVPKVRKKFIDS